jgi:glutamate-1-semialdehyde 2,1-aminomutase
MVPLSKSKSSLTDNIAAREDSVRAKTPGSLARFERAVRTLAGGIASGVRRGARPHPLYFDHGKGSRVWDVDGNQYIDYGLAWGPLILGHSPDCVVEALLRQAPKALTYGAQHDLEYEVSELLNEIIPCADLVAYANSGTEIVQVALRLARAVTGRLKYLKFEGHYHGWADSVLVSHHPSAQQGRPAPVGKGQLPHDYVVVVDWNDREQVESAFQQHELSAIICEALLANSGSIPPEPGFLEFLREITTRNGALLILDEVITGLRIDLGGAQTRFGIVPDIATFAKAVGAGVPLSVLAGKREFMRLIADGEVVHAGSLNGNPLILAAARAALTKLRDEHETIYPRLRTLGQTLADGLVRVMHDAGYDALTTGDGAVFTLHLQSERPRKYRDILAGNPRAYSDFAVALLDEGVIVLPDSRWYISAAHTAEDIDATLAAAKRAAASIARV